MFWGGFTSMYWMWWAAAAVVLWLLLQRMRRAPLDAKKSHGLRFEDLPGPLILPLIGSAWLLLFLRRKEFFLHFDQLTRKHWPIFKTQNASLLEVHISDPHLLEEILHSSVHIEKGPFYKFLHPWLGTGLLTSSGQKWFSHRKLLTPTFHFKILESFQEVFAERSLELVQLLEKEVSNTEGFDVYPYITRCALDIICETAMGTEINAQRDKHSPYVDAIYQTSELTIMRAIKPWLHPDFIYNMIDDGKKYKSCLNILHSFTNKIIQERKKQFTGNITSDTEEHEILGKKKRKAFLDLLLEANQEKKLLTDEEIREEVDTFMFEGHDTTSASLCWTLLLMGNHMEEQERVYEEQKAIFGDSDRLPTMQDLSEMKYLEMVIKESLRLYPSVPFILRMINEDITIGEYSFKKGIQAVIHIYHVHRNPKHFAHPDTFNPDNFLPERVQGRHPYAYIPFSAGPRNCIGQKFALLEEKTLLSTVLRHYCVRSLDKPEDINVLAELVMRPEKGIRLVIEKR